MLSRKDGAEAGVLHADFDADGSRDDVVVTEEFREKVAEGESAGVKKKDGGGKAGSRLKNRFRALPDDARANQ